MRKIKIKNPKGYTLVEVLVAIFLLATIGVGLIAALGGATKVLLSTDVRETARDYAQAEMEWVQSQPSVSSGDYIDLSSTYPSFNIPSITVSPVPDNEGIHIVTINITQGSSTTPIFSLEGRKIQD